MEAYSPPARITFLSHAATSAQRVVAFPLDDALESTEVEKIAAMRWIAPRAQQILCGPERRACQTAVALGLVAVPSSDLRDCDYGAWRGQQLEELQTSDPEGLMAWLTDVAAVPHGGESIVQLIERAGRWLEDQQGGDHMLAITHPAVIRAALVHALGAPPEAFWKVDIAPLTVTDLRFNGRFWTLRSVGLPLT
nr:histidine phosphatase family protein [Granulicella sp. dw_53]